MDENAIATQTISYDLHPSQVLDKLYGDKAYGYAPDAVATAEQRLGIQLPKTLRDYFLKYGAMEINHCGDKFYTPDQINFAPDSPSERHLAIWAEEDGDFIIGIRESDLQTQEDDPPVYLQNKGETKWGLAASTITSLLLLTINRNVGCCKKSLIQAVNTNEPELIKQFVSIFQIDVTKLTFTHAETLCACWHEQQKHILVFTQKRGRTERLKTLCYNFASEITEEQQAFARRQGNLITLGIENVTERTQEIANWTTKDIVTELIKQDALTTACQQATFAEIRPRFETLFATAVGKDAAFLLDSIYATQSYNTTDDLDSLNIYDALASLSETMGKTTSVGIFLIESDDANYCIFGVTLHVDMLKETASELGITITNATDHKTRTPRRSHTIKKMKKPAIPLAQTIEKLKQAVNRNSNGHLHLAHRLALLRQIGKRTIIDKIFLECAKKVFPIWKAEYRDDTSVYKMLQAIDSYLYHKKGSRKGLIKLADDNKNHMEGINSPAGAAGLTAQFTCYGGGVLDTEEYEGENDNFFDYEDWLPDYHASMACSDGNPFSNTGDMAKRQEFWHWYLGMVEAVHDFPEKPFLHLDKP